MDSRVSTHSRPKAAEKLLNMPNVLSAFQHTAARRRLCQSVNWLSVTRLFQHTAARRRLDRTNRFRIGREGFNTQPPEGGWTNQNYGCGFPVVSTHSRPKAAGFSAEWAQSITVVSTHSRPKAAGQITRLQTSLSGFNTQPPEGGWT